MEVEAKTSRSSDFERLMNESYVALPKLLEVISIMKEVIEDSADCGGCHCYCYRSEGDQHEYSRDVLKKVEKLLDDTKK